MNKEYDFIDEIKKCGKSFAYFVANYGEGILISDEFHC
jgi:hypothetical protein